jgi:hypothetical protein
MHNILTEPPTTTTTTNTGTASHWIDLNQIYTHLDKNPGIRTLNSLLDNFYTTYHDLIMGKIRDADVQLALLMESANRTEFNIAYSNSLDKNDAIESLLDWENNERLTNEWYVTVMREGAGVLTANDKANIKILSNTCPYIAGTAVYKARTLNALFEPMAQYNDRVICNGNASSRTNSNQNINIDSLDEALAFEAANVNQQEFYAKIANEQSNNKLLSKLYPNPATNNLTIQKINNKSGDFYIYNLLGQEVKHLILTEGLYSEEVNINTIIDGIYIYKIILADAEITTGKLEIKK